MAEKLDYQVMAKTLMGAVNESVTGFLKVKSDKDPTIVTKVQYAKDKLDISTYGEFIDGSYISVIYFYHHEGDKGSKRYCGMFILYVNTAAIHFLVRTFGYKNATEAGEAKVADAVAEFNSNIAGLFKKSLNGMGYPELVFSAPLKFKGFADSLDFPKGQNNFHRITAYVWGQTLTMDVILAI